MDGHDEDGKPKMYIEDNNSWGQPTFHLGHSCDEWTIGGTEQAKEFIAMLQKLVDENPDVPNLEFR